MTLATAYAEAPKKILMIGLGGGVIATYLARFMPDVTITTVELDPGVIEAAKKYFGILESDHVRYLESDGRVFLRRSTDLHDLILVDAYYGDQIPFHLLTKEFYTLVKQRLTPSGAAAFNVRTGTKLYAATLRTLKEVFSNIDVVAVNDYQVIVIAANSSMPGKEVLERRASALQDRYRFRYPLPQILSQRLDPAPAVSQSIDLLTDDFAPVELYNTLR
jgi:spermidine synthase